MIHTKKMAKKAEPNAFFPELAFHADRLNATGAIIHQGKNNCKISAIMAMRRNSMIIKIKRLVYMSISVGKLLVIFFVSEFPV